jgi:hypothetical protein
LRAVSRAKSVENIGVVMLLFIESFEEKKKKLFGDLKELFFPVDFSAQHHKMSSYLPSKISEAHFCI